MKAQLIVDASGPNPDWDRKDPQSSPSVDVPKGTIVEDPMAWVLVCSGRAIPADKECWALIEKRNPALADKIRKKFPADAGQAAADKKPKKGTAESQA